MEEGITTLNEIWQQWLHPDHLPVRFTLSQYTWKLLCLMLLSMLYVTPTACRLQKVCCHPDRCCLQARTVAGAQLYPVTALVEISLMAAILDS